MSGTMALVDGGRVNFARLRADRHARVQAAMADLRLDALLLGRPANISYATGARQLWTAGARPFGPACVVLRDGTYLLSTWDEGVPAEIPHEHLYGLTWNPANLVRRLAGIEGLPAARRVGTDSTSPGVGELLASIAPQAELIDAAPALARARAVKTGDEIACIETAAAVAEAAATAITDALRAGVSERELTGLYLSAIAGMGLPTPPTEAVVCATPKQGPVRLRRVVGDRVVGPGELVVVNPGALYAGYEGGVGRTWLAEPSDGATAAQRRLAARCERVRLAVVEACRAGSPVTALVDAWARTGEPAPDAPIAYGLGVGVEPPIVMPGVGGALQAGQVLAVEAWVAEEGAGGFLERDLVVIGDDGPRVVTRFGRGPVS